MFSKYADINDQREDDHPDITCSVNSEVVTETHAVIAERNYLFLFKTCSIAVLQQRVHVFWGGWSGMWQAWNESKFVWLLMHGVLSQACACNILC